MITLSKKLSEKKSENNTNTNNNNNNILRKRASIRDTLLIKDAEVEEMERNLPQTCVVKFTNPNELFRFELFITPEESYWSGGQFKFNIDVPQEYNIFPPKVKCETRIWHPNINEDGEICLSLLRASSIDGLGWAPTRTLKDVIWGLNSLFTDLLNFDDPLNDKAAEHYLNDRESFRAKVREYVHKYAKP